MTRGDTDSGTSTPRCLDSPNMESSSSGSKVSHFAAHLLMKAERLNESPQTKIQSANLPHALHESHTTSSSNATTSITTGGPDSSSSRETLSPSTSEIQLEEIKPNMVAQKSPPAIASDWVLGRLSKNKHSLNMPRTTTQSGHDSGSNSNPAQHKPVKDFNQSDSAS